MKVKAAIGAIAFSMLAISSMASAKSPTGELSKQQQEFAEKKDQITHASDFIYIDESKKEVTLFQSDVKKDSAETASSSAK